MTTPRKRIVDAAVQVFGRKGYKAATVRDICKSARVNLAALNYYFGNKEALYRTVVTDLLDQAIERYPADMDKSGEEDSGARLKLFIKAILHRLLAPGGFSGYQGHARLLARELADPSPVLDTLVADHIGPQVEILRGIITDLIGDAGRERVMRCAFSIIGQCFYYGYAWPIAQRLCPMDLSDPAVIKKLADHIAEFSLVGLKGLAGENARQSGGSPQ